MPFKRCKNREEWLCETFDLALKNIARDSVPGYCAMSSFGATNGVALGWDPIKGYDPDRVDKLRQCVFFRISAILSEVDDFQPYDDIKIFIKQEPHKEKKIANKMFRLISAVSLVDSTIDRMLFQPLASHLLKNNGATPCWVGWNPLCGGYQRLVSRFGGRVVSIDKSSWDWTFPGWMLYLILEILVDSLIPGAPSWFYQLLAARFRFLFCDAIFRFPDGVRVKQEGWGVMKSGCFFTIFLNSFGQSIVHYTTCIMMGFAPLYKSPIVFGDDTIQEEFPEYLEYAEVMKRFGILPKVQSPSEDLEFIGFVVEGRKTLKPSYRAKHVFALRHVDDEVMEDTLFSYQLLYAQDPDFRSEIQENILRLCPQRFISPIFLIRWSTGDFDLPKVDISGAAPWVK